MQIRTSCLEGIVLAVCGFFVQCVGCFNTEQAGKEYEKMRLNIWISTNGK